MKSTPCMSRHFGNGGKFSPPVAWSVTYGCVNDHAFEALTCEACTASLVDGRQRCGKCFQPMVVSHLEEISDHDPDCECIDLRDECA